MNRFSITGLLCLVSLGIGQPQLAHAQDFRWPEEPQNLKVLPEGTKGRELGQVMRNFSIALGVRCEHCHVGEGNDLSQYDFAADDKAAKRKARVMIEMLAAVNDDFLPRLSAVDDEKNAPLAVTCITCHRKNTRPVMLEDLLSDALHAGGVDAAAAKYRELRDQYYGGFTYDFSAGALARFAEQLAREQDFDSAIRLAQMDIDMNGESYSVYWALGGIQERAQLIPDAIASYRKGLELAPDAWRTFFTDKIRKLSDPEE